VNKGTTKPYEVDPGLALGRIAMKDFADERTLERLLMHERRIENSLYKTMRELQRLKNTKNGARDTSHETRPTPYGSRVTRDESRLMQNKPNYESTASPPTSPNGSRGTGHESRLMQNKPNFTPHAPKNPINHSWPQAESTNNQSSIINNQLKGPIKLTESSKRENAYSFRSAEI
jgi:hypothetical protein